MYGTASLVVIKRRRENVTRRNGMAIIDIALTYKVWVPTRVKLPEGRQWEDVKSVHAKWDTLFFCFKDGVEWETELASEPDDFIDFKYPSKIGIFSPLGDADDEGAWCRGEIIHEVHDDHYEATDTTTSATER
jgi:hypothetical protein